MEDDDEKEEEEIEEEENEEEEEDLNDIPLFEDNSEVIVELSNHESSLVPTESASAPPTSSILAQGSDLRTEDLQEEEEIMKFFENGCGCGNDCHKLFSESYIRTLRSDMLQMTRSEYDLVKMTQIKATSMGGQTIGNKRKAHERQRDTYNYMHEGQKVVLYHLNSLFNSLLGMKEHLPQNKCMW